MLPVVFVHGLIGPFAEHRALAQLPPAVLSAPDLLGYGALAEVDPRSITLEAQLDCLRVAVDRAGGGSRVRLVAHSVGAVIAASFAHRHPERVACLVNVEGNFTLADAFWSARLAAMTPERVRGLLQTDRDDPARWLRDAGIRPTEARVRAARHALAYQPATTVHAMAAAVVAYTGDPGYQRLLRDLFARTPVHLVAGANSRTGWDVPDWALAQAASYTEIPDAGHHLMIEQPETFGAALARLLAT